MDALNIIIVLLLKLDVYKGKSELFSKITTGKNRFADKYILCCFYNTILYSSILNKYLFF